MEILDIYNDEMKKVGTANRVDVHSHGYWHKTIHAWIIYRKNGDNMVALQLRSSKKGNQASKYDTTAAGHYTTDETIKEGLREVEEELGISGITQGDLIPLGLRMTASYNSDKCTTNREFQDVFFIHKAIDIETLPFDPVELDGLIEVKAVDGIALFENRVTKIAAKQVRYIDGDKTRKVTEDVTIEKSQIIKVKDNYYYKVFVMAELYLNGWKHVSI